MPLVDVNHKKDVAKEGDKPVENGRDVAHDARQTLSLEATKPGTKVEGKAETKAETKSTASEGYGSYLSGAVDQASTLMQQTLAMLPSLSIVNENGKQMDKTHSINKSLDLDGLMLKKSNEQKTTEASTATIAGFSFHSDKKVEQLGDKEKTVTEREAIMSNDDWQKITRAYDLIGSAKGSKIESTTFGTVHRDSNGKVDDVRHNGQTDIKSKTELLSLNTDGATLAGLDGAVKLKLDKNGRAEGQTASGSHFIIETNAEGEKQFYLVDAQGNPTSDVYEDEKGQMVVAGKFVNGKIVSTEGTLDAAGGILKVAEAMKAEAIRTKSNQIKRFTDGIMTVTPDGTVLAAKSDHTSLMSTKDGRYIVRSHDGSLTIYEPGKEPVKLSKEVVVKELARKLPQMLSIHSAMKQLMSFGVNNVLTSEDGRAAVSVKDNKVSGKLNEAGSATNSAGQIVNTGLLNGDSQVIDTKTHTVLVQHNNGTSDKIEMTAKGDFKFEGKGFTYNDGVATTADGNKISAEGITMANGNVYHNDGSVNYADGSKITASGQIMNSSDSQRTEKAAAQQAAESQANSAAGYAMGLAGAMRSKAASGHATAGDIAALEATFAGLCEAVSALSSAGDLSTQFKLYSAEGSVSESLNLGYAHLNDAARQPQTMAA